MWEGDGYELMSTPKKYNPLIIAEAKKLARSLLTFFWKPFPWQKKALEIVRKKNTTAIICCNKNGKTCFGANTVISWALGYEPWQRVDKDDPDALEVGGKYYRRSSLGIAPPVNIIIVGEDWKLHLGRTIVPELKKWAPEGWYETKKNEQGVEYLWTWNNKSTFTIMCYTQDDDLFEGFRAQGAWEDEPPEKKKHQALSRGLLLDGGKTLMTLTPLKEAWILDDIVLSGRKDIGVIDGLMLTDNPMLYGGEIKILKDAGFTDERIEDYFNLLFYDDFLKKTYVTDKGHKAENFLLNNIPVEKQEEIYKLKILKFIKDIEPVDVPPRVFGQFKHLVGRVLKSFDMSIHSIKPFIVPTKWPVTAMIDWHPGTPQAISYWAVDERDIHYCIGEVWRNMSSGEIADDIIRKKIAGWRIEDVYIDPLAKGDTAYLKNMVGTDVQSSFNIIYDKLSEHGISLTVATKDKDSGIENIREWLRGVNGLATCYIFNNCERHFYEVMRWVIDENTGKPSKESDDHFMENWYRYTLTGTKYSEYQITPLSENTLGESSSPITSAWMGV